MTETLNRPRAFIPHHSDEGPFDYLGFWHHGILRGEWSGTAVWLADMPLPQDYIVEGIVRDFASLPEVVGDVRAAVAEGRTAPAVFLGPVESASGWAVLPVQGQPFDANPNFVAHIERGIPGGEWFVTTEPVAKMRDAPHHAVLVYVVDGEARGLVAPVKHAAEPLPVGSVAA